MTPPKYVSKYAPINLGLTLKIQAKSVSSDVLPMSTDKTIHVNAYQTVRSGAHLPMIWLLSVSVNALPTLLPTTGQWDVWRNVQQVHMLTTLLGDVLLNALRTQPYTPIRQNTCAWSTVHQTFTVMTWQEHVWTNALQTQSILLMNQQTDATKTVYTHTSESQTLVNACWVAIGASIRICRATDASDAHHHVRHVWANWVAKPA